jgi:hypothetical protein|tara:strand:- start:785 stop:1027 length:243 start_codon:yes stop_codon:yes gene_type:complete
MSIRLEVAYRDLLARVDALEKRLDAKTPPVVEAPEIKKDGTLIPKHLHFGKWALADNDGNIVDHGPYSKEAAKAAAQLVG